MNLTAFLDSNAAKFPTTPAIGFKKKEAWATLAWRPFRDLVFRTANALRGAGIAEGDRVAIFSDNSAEWITMDLAALALGAVTVPLYSTNDLAQTRYILDETEAKMILTGTQGQYDIAYETLLQSNYLEMVIASKKSTWIKKDRSHYFEDFVETMDAHFTISEKSPQDLATIIYTSGTTGAPKGVMLSHGNFTECFRAHDDFFKFKNFENEISLAFLPLTHVFERSWTLLCLNGGAQVNFLDNPKLIAKALEEVRPTMMCAVPRFYQKIYAGVQENVAKGSSISKKIFAKAVQIGREVSELKRQGRAVPAVLAAKYRLMDALVFSKIKAKLGGRLSFLPCGGSGISPEITKFFDAIGLHIIAGYGLTESTATLCCLPKTNYEYGTVGVPIGDTQIRIGDNDEILAKGSGIMLGYYKKPEDTASAFTQDGWFRTGDAGEISASGALKITDRIKDLMKTSNGKYIAPQAIENLLTDSSLVEQVMVVAEDRPFVTALIVPNYEVMKREAEKQNIPFKTPDDAGKMEVVEWFHKNLQEIQQSLPAHEKIKKFTLLPSEFEIDAGEITPTLKIKRKVIAEKYSDVIESMYHA